MKRIVLLLSLAAALLLTGVVACSGGEDSGNGAGANGAGAGEATAVGAATAPVPETPAPMPTPTTAAASRAVSPVSADEHTPTPAPDAAPTLAPSPATTPGATDAPLAALPEGTAYGDYAVGTVTGFAVDNRQRFDPWNTAYASPQYREMLRRVEASGQRRTVDFRLWYPAVADTAPGRPAGPRSAYPAAGGAGPDAAPAEGRFPVIVLSHGLGGAHSMWGALAGFLVSHGYIVAAPSFISDSSRPMVFEDEDSPFAAQSTPQEVQQAYNRLRGEGKVIPSFYRLMFGGDPDAPLIPGGIERTTTMMRNLFRQRVADVGLLLHTVRLLGEEPDVCRAALESMGATSAARNLCGLLAGRVSERPAGLAGHSLGSMTSLLGVNHLPGVGAALGFNNGIPFTWTPEEMYGAGETADGLPVGSRRPTMVMIGDEDAFVQGVFINLFQTAVSEAGGDPATAFPLEAERAWPERAENPQPVALSGWQRSTGDRSLVIVRDVNHDVLVREFDRNSAWLNYQRGDASQRAGWRSVRKPTGAEAFQPQPPRGEEYALLDWAELGDGSVVYLPHLIRDWYARAWFDWYLKGDEAARQRLQSPDPFGALTHARTEVQ